MKKTVILFLSLFAFCHLSNAQQLPDSSKYYLDIKDYDVIYVLRLCIKNIYEWNLQNNHRNGIFTIYVSNNDAGTSMRVIHSYPKNDTVNTVPDYYSYIDNQIIFWHTGQSFLSVKKEVDFEKFVSGVYAKFAAVPEKIPQPKKEVTQAPQRKKSLDDNVPHTVTAEMLRKLPIERRTFPPQSLIPQPPVFVVNKGKGGRISVVEEKRIW